MQYVDFVFSYFSGMNAIFQATMYVTNLPPLCTTICTTARKFLSILLVVELLIKNSFSFGRIKTI